MDGTDLLPVVRHLHQLAAREEPSDGELLHRFALGREEAAFALLMRRHGPMVLGVCRRLLGQDQDAEDVFQAAFLVLARKAGSIRRGEALAGWLYRVAYRLAVQVRAEVRRRRLHERQVHDMPDPRSAPDTAWQDLRPILDEELHALPDRYRLPVLLCHLEGKTHAQAARELGWPQGTVAGRLSRARALLRSRLSRRGVSLSVGVLPAWLDAEAAPAAVPPLLARTTLTSAIRFAAGTTVPAGGHTVALANRALSALLPGKVKLGAAVLLALVVAAAGAGLLARPAPDGEPPLAPPAQAGRPRPERQSDPLPPGVLRRLGSVCFRSGNGVESLAFSPDGKTLISSSLDGFRLWDAGTGEQRAVIKDAFGASPRQAAFSPDGRWVACPWELNGKISLRDARTGAVVREIRSPTRAVAFSPDGKVLASAQIGVGIALLHLWDAATGTQIRQFGDLNAEVDSLAFSPDGKRLAAGIQDRTVRVWGPATGKELSRHDGIQQHSAVCAFTPDGNLVAAGADRTIRLWDAAGKERRRFEGHAAAIVSLAVSADGQVLASGDDKGTVRLWDTATGKLRHELRRRPIGACCVALSADGRTLATSDRGCLIRLWDTATGRERPPSPGHEGGVRAAAFSPDGKTIATGSDDRTILIWDRSTGHELRRLTGHTDVVTSVAFSPDGRLLASGSWDNSIRLWRAATGEPLHVLPGHKEGCSTVAFSPDGKVLASGGWDKTVRLWDAGTGAALRSTPMGGVVLSVVFSPDGKTLAAGGEHAVQLWDAVMSRRLASLGNSKASALGMAFSPDGQLLAGAHWTRTVGTTVWDVASRKELYLLGDYHGSIHAVAFSPDGRLIAESGDQHGTFRVWETATGKEVRRFDGHRGWVQSVAFSSDGRTLLSGSADGTALLWDVTGRAGRPPADLGDAALQALWHDLTGDDAAKAHRAVWMLAAAPRQALPRLRAELRPADPIEERRTLQWIADLDSDDFQVRQQATRQLEGMGEEAGPALRRALARKPTLEARRRLEDLLSKLGKTLLSPRQVRLSRALAVLEHMCHPEARRLLETLARGAPGAWLTQEAKATLRRARPRQDR